MELSSKAAIFLILQFVSAINLTSANYCEWNTCASWEYCCGDNICCGNTDATFYIYTFLCISGALLLLCCTLFYVCRFTWRSRYPGMIFGNYNNLARDIESSRTNLAAGAAVNVEPTFTDPPPSYSEVMKDRK